MARALGVLAGIAALYQIVVASRAPTFAGVFVPAFQHRAIGLLFGLVLIYGGLLRDAAAGRRERWLDRLLLVMSLVGVGYAALRYDAILHYSQYGYLDAWGIALAAMTGLVVLEAVRRTTGWVLPAIIVTFLLITMFQAHLPGLLHGKGYALDRLAYSVYVGTAGIFGMPLGVAVTIVVSFIVFGRLLELSGSGAWLIRLSLSVAGATTGGAAKVAIVASGLFGTISGSPSANVATIGTITIPLMRANGYPARFAGAVEAAASTGGQFMPPVMGAVAFIMAEALGIPYARIIGMAAVPALLYFAVLFMSVHFEAGHRGLAPLARRDLPRAADVVRDGWFYLIPIGALVYFLLGRNYPPELAALLSGLVLVPVSFLAGDPACRLTPTRIWTALATSARSWLPLVVITAAVGMLIGALELSGLGVKFSGAIVQLSAGNLLVTLVLVGVASLVLGMGLDSIPAYITLSVLAAPALVDLGVAREVAHLFVLYWGLASFITPPTCLAVYVACSISGSSAWDTGWEAVRLGIAAYLVPFAFVYNPALLGRAPALAIVIQAVTALVAATLVAAALRGYAWRPLRPVPRLLLAVAGSLLISPIPWLELAGAGLAACGLWMSARSPRGEAHRPR
jgi:TRAP transporter 4TM/12TM fusion protein